MNEEILKSLEESIKDYPRLTFRELQEKYKEYKKYRKPEKKNQVRKEMVEGSLYVVLERIKNSIYSKLKQNIYDLNDVFTSFVIAWAETITSDKMETSFHSYSQIFNNFAFNNDIVDNLFGEKKGNFYTITFLDSNMDEFVALFISYIELLSSKFTDENEKELFIQELLEKYPDGNIHKFEKLVDFFDQIIDSFDCDINLIEFSSTNIRALWQILIANGFENFFNDRGNYSYDSMTENYERYVLNAQLQDYIKNTSKITERQRQNLIYRYGLGEQDKLTLLDIKEVFNISRERVRQIEEKSKEKIRIANTGQTYLRREDMSNSQELTDEEYKTIIDVFGREVRRAVDKYYEKNGCYPSYDEIKDNITCTNVKPVNIRISDNGDIVIPNIIIPGVISKKNISFVSKLGTNTNNPSKSNDTLFSSSADNYYQKLFNSLRNNPYRFISLPVEIKNNLRILDFMLKLKPSIVFDEVGNIEFNNDSLLKIYSFENICRLFDKGIKNISEFFEKFKRVMLDSQIITEEEFIEIIISLLKTKKYDIYSYLPEGYNLNNEVILNAIQTYPDRIMNSPTQKKLIVKSSCDNELIMNEFIALDFRLFDYCSDRLKFNIPFLKNLIKLNSGFDEYLVRNYKCVLLYKVLYLLSKEEHKDYFSEILNSTGWTLRHLYKYLHEILDDSEYANALFITALKSRPTIIKFCPEVLEDIVIAKAVKELGINPNIEVKVKTNKVVKEEVSKPAKPKIANGSNKRGNAFYEIYFDNLCKYTTSEVINEFQSKGIITLNDLLNLDDKDICWLFENSENYEGARKFYNLMLCKYLNKYIVKPDVIYEINDVTVLYNMMSFSDTLIRALINRRFAKTAKEFFYMMQVIRKGKFDINLRPDLKEELLIKSEIFENYTNVKGRVRSINQE